MTCANPVPLLLVLLISMVFNVGGVAVGAYLLSEVIRLRHNAVHGEGAWERMLADAEAVRKARRAQRRGGSSS